MTADVTMSELLDKSVTDPPKDRENNLMTINADIGKRQSSPTVQDDISTNSAPPADDNEHQHKKSRTKSNPLQNEPPSDAIESLLSVPLHYILRRTSSQNKKPYLLSRMEASLLLQITTLSYELDTLLQMSIEAIEKSHACKVFSQDIDASSNVYLRPIHCLLHHHGRIIPQQVIQHVQNNLEGILGHVPIIVQSLRQCAEQNYSVSNALDGMPVGMLGKEKGLLAEMEEEVCKRLEGLMEICNDGSLLTDSFDSESMGSFCEQMFGKKDERVDEDGNLILQHRTASINDAAAALGMLASIGSNA